MFTVDVKQQINNQQYNEKPACSNEKPTRYNEKPTRINEKSTRNNEKPTRNIENLKVTIVRHQLKVAGKRYLSTYHKCIQKKGYSCFRHAVLSSYVKPMDITSFLEYICSFLV